MGVPDLSWGLGVCGSLRGVPLVLSRATKCNSWPVSAVRLVTQSLLSSAACSQGGDRGLCRGPWPRLADGRELEAHSGCSTRLTGSQHLNFA
ncbi:hypothetical protein LZ30DRAFT_707766 [Colletotrichum cereale]|nr:hypothetical protein LZ30DRAFT_707766 [Colletotrichum cereale]